LKTKFRPFITNATRNGVFVSQRPQVVDGGGVRGSLGTQETKQLPCEDVPNERHEDAHDQGERRRLDEHVFDPGDVLHAVGPRRERDATDD
jgi:hypothetical protein